MKRTREHELETLSNAFLENFFSDWSCVKLEPDYGLDYKITIFEKKIITTEIFFVQVKATDTLKVSLEYIVFDIDVPHLLYYMQLPIPILFILYVAENKCAYWINIQKYCKEVLNIEDPDWKTQKKFKRIKIPISNKLIDKNLIKKEIEQSSKEILRNKTDAIEWDVGYERILIDPIKLEEIINKREYDSIKTRLHLSDLYFKRDDQVKLNEQFIKIYNQKRKDKYQLEAILGIITSKNPLDLNINEKLHNLSLEGLNLAKNLREELYYKFFLYLTNFFEYFRILIQKLPIIYRKAEIIKNKENIEIFIKFIWDSQQIEIDRLLLIRIKTMQEILVDLLKKKQIYEFLILIMYQIQSGNSINALYMSLFDKSKLLNNFLVQERIIKLILKLAELVKDDDLYLHIYSCIGGFYESIREIEGIKIYQIGLNIAKQKDHHHYIKLFNENINNYGEGIKFYLNNEILNKPIAEVLEGLNFFHFSKIDSISDPHLKDLLSISKNDSDPTKILKSCIYLLIGYFPSPLGQALGIYSLGSKIILCSKNKTFIELFNLKEDYKLFQNKFCLNCKDILSRKEDWYVTLNDLEKMREKIIEIIKI